jgi:hypothetical protein
VAVVDVLVLAATFGKLAATGAVLPHETADAELNGPKRVNETVPAGDDPAPGVEPFTVAVSEMAVPKKALVADCAVEMLT